MEIFNTGSVKIQHGPIGGEQKVCEVLIEEGMRNSMLL